MDLRGPHVDSGHLAAIGLMARSPVMTLSWTQCRHGARTLLSVRPGATTMIRITTRLEGSLRTIKVDGRLLSSETAELVRACQGSAGTLVIDLSDLSFADDGGVRVLKELRENGAKLHGIRLYLSTLLEDQADP